MIREGKAFPMTRDHKPTDDAEAERILSAGSIVTGKGRIDGNLNVSRGLGDHDFKDAQGLPLEAQAVSPMPDVRIVARAPTDQFLLLACDGLWETLEIGEAAGFLLQKASDGETDCQNLANSLIDEAYKLGSGDNITAIVVKLA